MSLVKERHFSRRAFLGGLLLLFAGGGILFRRRFVPATASSKDYLDSLCNHMLPRHGVAPGALELGISQKFLDAAESRLKERLWLETLTKGLESRNYLALSSTAQVALIETCLNESQGSVRPTLGRAMRYLLDSLATMYYTHPQVFPALSYRVPQPAGFPEFGNC